MRGRSVSESEWARLSDTDTKKGMRGKKGNETRRTQDDSRGEQETM